MRRLLVGLAACFFLVAAGLPVPSAMPDILADARAQYPHITGTRLDNCSLCHTSAPAFNPYGAAFDAAGQNFGAIESADSDGDGFSNIVEITALTFPGDASDKPAGGGGRIVGRGTLEPGSMPFALAAAPDTDRDEGLIVWADGGAAREGAKADASITTWLVDKKGSPIKKAASFGSGDVSEDHGVGAAYAAKKKRFVTTWTSPDDAAMAQLVKSKTNKKVKKPVEVAEAATGPVPDWDADLQKFLIASATSAGVAIDELNTKGKVSRHELGRSSSDVIAEFATALGFTTGALDSGRLLLAAADTNKGLEPGTALIEDGMTTVVDAGVAKASKKGTGMAAAMMERMGRSSATRAS